METLEAEVRAEQDRLSRAAADEMVTDAAVHWALGWSNTPDLYLRVREGEEKYRLPAPFTNDDVYHPFVVKGGGTYWIQRRAPLVRFLYEDRRPAGITGGGSADRNGALGRTVITPEGDEYRTYGGWSSSDGAINRLRLDRPEVQELLPEEIVEATFVAGEWGNLGMAGCAWDLSWMRERLAQFCPGVDLFSVASYADEKASSEQALIIHAGFPLREGETGARWIPYPADTPGDKPSEDSTLFKATSYDLKRRPPQ